MNREDNKKLICLVHGWGANSQKLEPLKAELQKLGWKVFLPQLPFFDQEEPKFPWRLQDFADFIDLESKKFFTNEPYVFFGHSLGGRIGLKTTAENPLPIKGLVLCAAAGISRTGFVKRAGFEIITKVFGPLKKSTPAFFPLIKKICYRLAGTTDYAKINSEIKKQTFVNIVNENLKPLVPQITIPTFIIWGDKDKTTPLTDAYFLKTNIVSSNIKIFQNENHLLPYNQPKLLAMEINHWFEKV